MISNTLNKNLTIKIVGLYGEIQTKDIQIYSYLKSKLMPFLAKRRRTDFKIEIIGRHPSFDEKSLSRLIFKDEKFILCSEKDRTLILGSLWPKTLCGKICAFKDKPLLLHSVLLNFVFFLEHSNGLILHASAAHKNGEGFIFPGPANAGKSTIIRQIKKLSPLAEEWVAVKKLGSSFYIWNIPYQKEGNMRKKLKCILFPEKGRQTSFKRLNPYQAAKKLLSNCLFSIMHPETVNGVLERVTEMAEQVTCYDFEFPLHACLDREILSVKNFEMSV